MANWTDISDPPLEQRHTYGADVNTGLRIVLGDNVRIGGQVVIEFTDVSDPASGEGVAE